MLQNLLVKALGHTGHVDSMTYMEYHDYDDVATNGFLDGMLQKYRSNSILDYFGITSEEFLMLDPLTQNSYFETATMIKKEEIREMEEAKQALQAKNSESEGNTDPTNIKQPHQALQDRYDARMRQLDQSSDDG